MKKLALVISVLLFVVSCVGNDGGTTKKDLCYKMVDAYCAALNQYSCEADGCVGEGQTQCNETFADSNCQATVVQVEHIDHVIDFWIKPKTDCASLYSLYTSLAGEAYNLDREECADSSDTDDDNTDGDTNDNNDDNTTTKTNGAYCEELLGILCDKVVEYNCAEMDKAACMTNLYSSGLMYINDTYTCTTASDDSTPDDALKSAFTQQISLANSVSNCTDMGF